VNESEFEGAQRRHVNGHKRTDYKHQNSPVFPPFFQSQIPLLTGPCAIGGINFIFEGKKHGKNYPRRNGYEGEESREFQTAPSMTIFPGCQIVRQGEGGEGGHKWRSPRRVQSASQYNTRGWPRQKVPLRILTDLLSSEERITERRVDIQGSPVRAGSSRN